MGRYVITLDSGTTNTRALLWEDRQVIAKAKREVGVRNTAIDGSNVRLKDAIRSCIQEVLASAGRQESDLHAILASGMISSNVGLAEIAHCTAPVSAKMLSEAVRCILLNDVCHVPITFIPGVKNCVSSVDLAHFSEMDMMRGEEVESLALLSVYPEGRPYLLILPGSHMKFVSADAQGRLTGCLTSISGELLSCITEHTIIADAVGRQFASAEFYDSEMVILGYEEAKRAGLGRACFSARILSQFGHLPPQQLANYVLGTVIQSDIVALNSAQWLALAPETAVVVSGKDPLRQAMADVLRHEGRFKDIDVYTPEADIPLSAIGARKLAELTWESLS